MGNNKSKLFRITTIAGSLNGLLKGQLRYMNTAFDVYGVSASGNGKINKVAEREGVKVIPVEMTRQITPLKDIKSVYQLYRILRKHKPLIVHTHTPKAGIVGMFASWLARVPLRLHDVAGLPLLEAQGSKRKLLDIVEKMTYAFASHVYPNSHGLKAIITQNNYCNPNKLKVLGDGSSNGTDTQYFNPSLITDTAILDLKAKLGIKETDHVFVFIGRLVTDKGVNELVAAFCELHNSVENTKLVLVGPHEPDLDPLLPETEKLIAANTAIITPGTIMDVRPYYAIADAFVFPSYREGFPNVVMEANAMGIPAIVSDINGNNEIIEHGKSGIIIPVKDSTAILDEMTTFMKNPKAYVTLPPSEIRNSIIEKYDCKKIWKYISKEYALLTKELQS
ncbi:glycosyltransferase family 4 protein [Maribacter sp. R77961]|uniref:glycosyltransferase family 4 protein n=1 Tax=Maribacter sp. R77961 TaxID=3093871 RepID=UPI0037CB38D1